MPHPTMKRIHIRLHPVVLFAALSMMFSAGCSKTPEPSQNTAPPHSTEPAAHASPDNTSSTKAPSGPTEIAWDAPASFQQAENPNPMRKATYKITRAQGDAEDAELSVSKAGGSTDMNIKRWQGQFENLDPNAVKRAERKNGDLKIVTVEMTGTFNGSGMPGAAPSAPKANFTMLGAIVETAQGSWFFKLTGPEKTVAAAKGDFDKLIESIRAK